MKIVRAEKVWDRGRYHAWTDLAFFKGKYYLGFRTGSMHTSGDGVAEVLQSEDTRRWRHCAKGIFKYGDECSPYLVSMPERLYLFLYSTWFDPEACVQRSQPLMFWTDNGDWWTGPVKVLPPGNVPWRPKRHNGRFYMAAYLPTLSGDSTVDLFTSPDGFTWEKIANIGSIHPRASETEIHFSPEGELTAYIRCEQGLPEAGKDSPGCGYLARAKPPYREFIYDKTEFVAGPLLTCWKGELLLLGRTYLKPEEKIAPWDTGDRTAIFRVNANHLDRTLILPSGGDSSYAGAVELPNGNLMVSYYSSHEFAADPTLWIDRSAIYLAEIQS